MKIKMNHIKNYKKKSILNYKDGIYMSEKRPAIIILIGYIGVLGALLSMVSLLPKFLQPFGSHFTVILLPIFSNDIVQVLLTIILLISSYGYLKLKIWGYWLMVINIIFFLVVNIISFQQSDQLFLCQNLITTVIELVFIVPTRRYFVKKEKLIQ